MNAGEIEATLKLKDEMSARLKEVQKEVADTGKAYEAFASVSDRSIGEVVVDLQQAKQHVSELMKLVQENADKPGFIAGLKAELDLAIPKVAMLETELAGMKGVINDTAGSTDTFGKSMSFLQSGLGAFGVTLGAAAVVGFGKSLLEDADALVKMSDKTGMSIENLQRFQIVGDDVGVTVEQMSSAINQFQNRMEKGSTELMAGLADLGLSISNIKAMSPDQQFIAISDAIREIKDPAEQTRIAFELFGKAGVEMLPALKKGFDDVKDAAAVMSEETVRKMDEAGDKIALWWRNFKGYAAEGIVAFVDMAKTGFDPTMYAMTKAAEAHGKAVQDMGKEMIATAKAADEFATGLVADQGPQIDLTIAARMHTDNLKEQKQAVHEATEAHKKLVEELKKAETGHYGVAEAVKFLGGTYDNTIPKLKEYLATMDKLAGLEHQGQTFNMEGIQRVGQTENLDALKRQLQNMADMSKFVGPTLEQARSSLNSLGEDFRTTLTGMPQVIMGALQGGGNVISSVGASIGSGFGQHFGKMATDSIGKHLSGTLGNVLSGAVGAALPVVGSLVGPLLDKLFSIGGPSKKELEGRELEKKFEDSFGGFDAMMQKVGEAYQAAGRSAQEAERDVRALMAAEKLGGDAVQTVIDQINKTVGLAAHQAEVLKKASSLYGPSKDDLKKAADNAHEIFDTMLKAGTFTQEQLNKAYLAYQKALADSGDEAAKMWLKLQEDSKAGGEAVNKVLDQLMEKRDGLAKAVAEEAPEEVMGVIETAQRAELANLDAQIADERKRMEAQAKAAADALEDAISNVDPDPIHVPIIYDLPPFPGGAMTEAPEVFPQAEGGDYMVTKPTLFLAGEAGPERATFVPSGSSSGGSGDWNALMDRMDARNDAFLFALKRTIRDAMMKR